MKPVDVRGGLETMAKPESTPRDPESDRSGASGPDLAPAPKIAQKIAEIEWSGVDEHVHGCCPLCLNYPAEGHTKDCGMAELVALAADLAPAPTEGTRKCVIGEYCSLHRFIHGAEAEELRERLEALKDKRVQAILDDVDARDSAAYLAAPPAPPQEKP